MKKKYAILAVILAALYLAVGCGEKQSGQADSSIAVGEQVIIAMSPTSEPTAGFDPIYGWGAGEHVHEPLIQSTLTVTNDDMSIGYDLALNLEVSDDGLLWRVDIRDDVYFTDQEQLTAEDVAFTFNQVKALSTVSDFTMLDYAEAEDDFTVAFHLNRPYAVWPYSMANVGIVPAHAYNERYGQNPIGSGRYKLVQWDKGQQVILEANADYYAGAPQMERVVIVFMDEATAYAAVKAKEVDLAYTAPAYAAGEVDGYHLLRRQTVDNRGINLPTVPFDGTVGNDVTADLAIRQAINLGLDRQKLIDHVLDGYGQPAYSVCDQMPWYNADLAIAYDPLAAQEILEVGGWRLEDDGVRVKNGLRAEVTVGYPAGDSLRQAIAAELCSQLAALGIAAEYTGVGWDRAYDDALSHIFVWGWGAHSPMEMYNIYHRASGERYARYSPYGNDQVDELMDQALAAENLEDSFALWQQAQSVYTADVPWVWLVNVEHLYWQREGLDLGQQKVEPHGHGWSIVNNVDQWSWQ